MTQRTVCSLKYLTSIFFTIISISGIAEPTTPKSNSEVVARWAVLNTNNNSNGNNNIDSLLSVAEFIDQGQYPGQADYRYGRAKVWLETKLKAEPNNDQMLYLYARVLQYQHEFDQALTVLNKSLQSNPLDINSLLLKANIYLVKGQVENAKQTCLQLLGNANMLTVSGCVLDATAQSGKLAESYKQLITLYERSNLNSNSKNGTATALSSNDSDHWIIQILAEMAYQQGLYNEAKNHLKNINIEAAPVSLIVLWADINLKLKDASLVLNVVSDIVSSYPIKDDALLLRLAIAEKMNNKGTIWQNEIKQRIKLRELREDKLHAADLALYYLELDKNPQKALFWAETNWTVAKQFHDRLLLSRAKKQLISEHNKELTPSQTSIENNGLSIKGSSQ